MRSQIGATPSVENCRAMLKTMPLESCSVTAAWRCRGCLTDAIIIQPSEACGSRGTTAERQNGGAGGKRKGKGGVGCRAPRIEEALPPPSAESPLRNASADNGGEEVPEVKNVQKQTLECVAQKNIHNKRVVIPIGCFSLVACGRKQHMVSPPWEASTYSLSLIHI